MSFDGDYRWHGAAGISDDTGWTALRLAPAMRDVDGPDEVHHAEHGGVNWAERKSGVSPARGGLRGLGGPPRLTPAGA